MRRLGLRWWRRRLIDPTKMRMIESEKTSKVKSGRTLNKSIDLEIACSHLFNLSWSHSSFVFVCLTRLECPHRKILSMFNLTSLLTCLKRDHRTRSRSMLWCPRLNLQSLNSMFFFFLFSSLSFFFVDLGGHLTSIGQLLCPEQLSRREKEEYVSVFAGVLDRCSSSSWSVEDYIDDYTRLSLSFFLKFERKHAEKNKCIDWIISFFRCWPDWLFGLF